MDRTFFISTLNDQLNDVKNLDQYRYLLIDGLGSVSEFSSITLPALQAHFSQESVIPIKRPDLSHDILHCPHLICLAEPGKSIDSHYIYRSMKEAISEYMLPRRYIAGWLVSELKPQDLADKIIDIGKKMSARVGGSFIPFYEPFRLSLFDIEPQYSNIWLKSMLKCCSHFYYVNVEGNLADVIGEPIGDTEIIYLPESVIFHQREAKSLFYLYESYQSILFDEGENIQPNAFVKLCEYYRQAISLGIDNLADRYIFSFYSMEYGDLTKQPIAKNAINQALNDPGTLGDCLVDIDDRDWIITESE